MASAPEPVGQESGNSGGDWLFKQGDMLLGPVPAKSLIDKLYRGEIQADTPVAREGHDNFVPIEQVEFFKLHAKKATVKVKVDTESVNLRMQESRSRNTKLAGFGVLGALLLGGGAFGAYWLAIHKPWRTADDADLLAINVEAPSISLATAGADEVAVAIPDGTPNTTSTATPGHKAPRPSGHHGGPTPVPNPNGNSNSASPDGLESRQQFDSSAIAGIAQQKANTIYPCIKTEAVAHPPAEQVSLPVEFTVGNDGKVTKLWIDNPDFRDGTQLYACILKTLHTWSFPHYEGEQASVKLKFSWGQKH